LLPPSINSFPFVIVVVAVAADVADVAALQAFSKLHLSNSR
jgi:hypothetical protein